MSKNLRLTLFSAARGCSLLLLVHCGTDPFRPDTSSDPGPQIEFDTGLGDTWTEYADAGSEETGTADADASEETGTEDSDTGLEETGTEDSETGSGDGATEDVDTG
jgi:hypothetical protein